jgi:hypothetical protein
MVAGLVAAWARSATGAEAEPAPRSAKEVRGASPYIAITDEPAPKLIVDNPLPDLKGALNASPRVGHLHIHVDDLPWWWADASNINTIDLAGMPPGPHTIRIVLVDANHEPFPGQSKTVTFTIPKKASGSHAH